MLLAASIAPGSSASLELMPPEQATNVNLHTEAHAELSVRTGGEWQDAVYSAEGFSFEEVTSFTSPPQLTDHSYFLRYEGPGWESIKWAIAFILIGATLLMSLLKRTTV